MALAVGMIGADGIVLAADSRCGTTQEGQSLVATSHFRSLLEVREGIWAAFVGDPGIATTLSWVLRHERGRLAFDVRLDDLAERASEAMRQKYDNWFAMTPPDQRPWVAILLAGYHRGEQEAPSPRVYQFLQPHFAPQRFDRGHTAVGWLSSVFAALAEEDTTELPVAELLPLARKLLGDAAVAYPLVGGATRTVVLRPDGGVDARAG
jgi:20S proteasome alpha/beta subunit